MKAYKFFCLGFILLVSCRADSFNSGVARYKAAAAAGHYQEAVTLLEGVEPFIENREQRLVFINERYGAYKALALSSSKDGDMTKAAAVLEKLVELYPDVAEARCLLAQALLEMHNLERGGVALSRCIAAAEKNDSEELANLVQALQSEYKQQTLLADGRLESLVELATNYPESPNGKSAAARLPSILLRALQNPEEAGPPQNGSPQPFTMYYKLLTVRFPDSPEAALAVENYASYMDVYNNYYAAELQQYQNFYNYQLAHSFCKQMELFYIKMRQVSLEVGMLVDIWIKSNNAKRMSGEERQRLAREYGREKVTSQQDGLIQLRDGIKNTRPANSMQKWIYGRMNTAINGLVNLQRVTDEYMATQNDRARQQRNNISSWLDFFILQLNLDIQWVCPDTDALPPTVNQEPI